MPLTELDAEREKKRLFIIIKALEHLEKIFDQSIITHILLNSNSLDDIIIWYDIAKKDGELVLKKIKFQSYFQCPCGLFVDMEAHSKCPRCGKDAIQKYHSGIIFIVNEQIRRVIEGVGAGEKIRCFVSRVPPYFDQLEFLVFSWDELASRSYIINWDEMTENIIHHGIKPGNEVLLKIKKPLDMESAIFFINGDSCYEFIDGEYKPWSMKEYKETLANYRIMHKNERLTRALIKKIRRCAKTEGYLKCIKRFEGQIRAIASYDTYPVFKEEGENLIVSGSDEDSKKIIDDISESLERGAEPVGPSTSAKDYWTKQFADLRAKDIATPRIMVLYRGTQRAAVDRWFRKHKIRVSKKIQRLNYLGQLSLKGSGLKVYRLAA